jgi:plasmid segregation protein ParM
MAKKEAAAAPQQDFSADYKGKPYQRIVGIDVANSTIKSWTDGEKSQAYRNTVKTINDAGLVYSFKTDYHMFVFNKEVYEVGDISVLGSGGRGKARYNSSNFKVEAIIGITNILEQANGEKIRVVTGVPSSLSKNTAVVEEMKRNLIGTYDVKSVVWDKVETVAFEIVDVIVVPQPLGTIYNYVYNRETGELDQALLGQRVLVIDIGWGTTDLAVLEHAQVRGTFGFEVGTSDCIAGVQEEVNTKMPEANIYALNPHELDLALLKSYNVETPFGVFDLAEIVEKHKRLQAENVYKSVMGIGFEYNKLNKIIITGGGALLYEKYLREFFNDPRLIIQEDAVLSNVHGFYLLGKF